MEEIARHSDRVCLAIVLEYIGGLIAREGVVFDENDTIRQWHKKTANLIILYMALESNFPYSGRYSIQLWAL